MNNIDTKISKYLSYLLRHKPEAVGLTMDKNGWVLVDELIEKSEIELNKEIIEKIVKNSDKQRFELKDGKIRANQGHSIDVDVELVSKEPPEILYHGTATRFLENIFKEGLLPQSRQYVHLSRDEDTALKVGQRHGKAIVLKIRALAMFTDGYTFFLSKNGVWLTKSVPIKYIKV